MGEVNRARDERIVVAVDGGGSKTDAVAIDRRGAVRAHARGGRSSPHLIGLDAAVELVNALIDEVSAQAGNPGILHANIYMSGLDLPAEVESFEQASTQFVWAQSDWGPAVFDNDLFALLRTGTAERNAVAIVCGTGINALGVHDDQTARYPALGSISGDWGGGAHLADRALWHAARSVDGRGPYTRLEADLPAFFGVETLNDVIEGLHFGTLANTRLATFAPRLFTAADDGDVVAGLIVDRQIEEIVTLAVTTLRRLDLLGRPTPVVVGGGVIGGKNPRLIDGIERELASRAPRATLIVETARPIVGAGLLALESAHATDDALALARKELSSIS